MFLQIGLPNAGKSTLVSAITESSIVEQCFFLPTTRTYEVRIMLQNPGFELLCQIYQPQVCFLFSSNNDILEDIRRCFYTVTVQIKV